MNRDRDRLYGVVELGRDLLGLCTDDFIACAMLSALTNAEQDTLNELMDLFPDVWADLENDGDQDDNHADRAYDQHKDNQLGVL